MIRNGLSRHRDRLERQLDALDQQQPRPADLDHRSLWRRRARTTTITYDSTWVHKPYTITKTNVTIDDRYDATYGTLTTHTLTDTTGGTTNGDTDVGPIPITAPASC